MFQQLRKYLFERALGSRLSLFHKFDKCLQVGYMNVHRLNTTKRLIAVNGKYPGPTIYVHEGDRLIINVTNHIKEDVAIHW